MTSTENRLRSKAARLRKLEHQLYNAPPGGYSVIALAKLCGVNRRTIYRDLDTLDEAGVPIWEHNGKYGIDRNTYLATIRLNLHEAIALFFAARLLSHHSDEHNPHIVSALDQLAAGLPDQTIASHIARLASIVRQRPPNPHYVEILELLTRAWADRRMVRIRYRAPNREPTEREIAPYFLEVARTTPGVYVIGYDRLRDDLRTFKVERIEHAALLDEQFSIPEGFDPYEHLARSWEVMNEAEVAIHLRFSPQAAPRIRENRWHHSQKLIDNADGSCDLHLTIAGIREILGWVLSWGTEVEVIAPTELRDAVINHARQILAKYT
ncbi:WYL domain-containing transcriptional regulator [Chloroflexus sp.]|uniref:helix-turn-helix transcriptional regulator n=1 Tax=Chloroflexus sp. TaxID=1904827 RepID=UPI00298EDB3B|nr:WYL domain-containing transcriptional regulator [Chloroflexus sp.]MCS6888751.1 transcriptional regulator [Chloroflexus sp.]MDW8406014.1 WYL domain-containing transcriptional regulator [Chloroflexus sp.]